jgi:hypothetical protein
MLLWSLLPLSSLLVGCAGEPETPPAEAPTLEITADQVLQRHIDVTKQCDLMVADSYLLEWEAVVTDKATTAKQERVLQQGRQGVSFMRAHQQTRPQQRFTAFGLSKDKTWWSAGDLGVRKDLPMDVAKTLMVHMDPTPVCSFQARWKDRQYLGEEDFGSERVHRVRGTWADDSTIELLFDVESGRLVQSETTMGALVNTLSYKKYEEHDGIQWPGEVISSRVEGPLHLFVAEKLLRLELNGESFKDIGHNEIAAVLAEQAKTRKAAAEKE